MVMPSAQGLFHRAAIQSGATLRSGTREAANETAERVLAQLGLNSDRTDLHDWSFTRQDYDLTEAGLLEQARTMFGENARRGWRPIAPSTRTTRRLS